MLVPTAIVRYPFEGDVGGVALPLQPGAPDAAELPPDVAPPELADVAPPEVDREPPFEPPVARPPPVVCAAPPVARLPPVVCAAPPVARLPPVVCAAPPVA